MNINNNTTALQSLLEMVEQLPILSEDDMELLENISSLASSCLFDYTPAIATLSPLSGIDYIVGISDLDAQTMHICAEAISNNSEITNTTTTVYISNGEINRKISVGDKIIIPLNGQDYSFAIIGFNHDTLTDNEFGYGHKTATGLAGMTLQLCEGFDTKYAIHTNTFQDNISWKNCTIKQIVMPLMESYMPAEWSFIIKLVDKSYDIEHDVIDTLDNNKCFLLAVDEIINKNKEKYYAQYAGYRQSNDFLKEVTYWTRSRNYLSIGFFTLSKNENLYNLDSQTATESSTRHNIVFAFCI